MKTKFLDYLVCPHCRSSLKLISFSIHGKDVEEGLLKCRCGRAYPIINHVARMLPDDLKNLVYDNYPDFFRKYSGRVKFDKRISENLDRKGKDKTAQAFGPKWLKFAELHKHHEEQFLDWIWPVERSFFKGKIVLDAGCGQGRHAYFSGKYGAKAVLGIDLSEAVDVAYQNTKHLDNVCIVQGDIYNLPFKEKSFDYAYSIGVLHHLPDPEAGFDSIMKYVKPKGHFSVWVYGRQGTLIPIFNKIRRHVLSRLPMSANLGLSWMAAMMLYPVIKYVYRPMNSNEFTRKIAYYFPQNGFFVYLSKLNFRIIHEILFDQFIAPTAFYYHGPEFERWFKKAKISSYQVTERNKNGWRGLARIR